MSAAYIHVYHVMLSFLSREFESSRIGVSIILIPSKYGAPEQLDTCKVGPQVTSCK